VRQKSLRTGMGRVVKREKRTIRGRESGNLGAKKGTRE
jgi:hypothetical protein